MVCNFKGTPFHPAGALPAAQFGLKRKRLALLSQASRPELPTLSKSLIAPIFRMVKAHDGTVAMPEPDRELGFKTHAANQDGDTLELGVEREDMSRYTAVESKVDRDGHITNMVITESNAEGAPTSVVILPRGSFDMIPGFKGQADSTLDMMLENPALAEDVGKHLLDRGAKVLRKYEAQHSTPLALPK